MEALWGVGSLVFAHRHRAVLAVRPAGRCVHARSPFPLCGAPHAALPAATPRDNWRFVLFSFCFRPTGLSLEWSLHDRPGWGRLEDARSVLAWLVTCCVLSWPFVVFFLWLVGDGNKNKHQGTKINQTDLLAINIQENRAPNPPWST